MRIKKIISGVLAVTMAMSLMTGCGAESSDSKGSSDITGAKTTAGVLQYAQTCFEGMKAYTTCDGRIVVFRPDLNGQRMEDSCKRLEMPDRKSTRLNSSHSSQSRMPSSA